MSNNGKVHVGIIACRESMPDVDDLAQRFPAELAKLKAAVRRSIKKPTPIRGARRPRRRPRPRAAPARVGWRKSRRRALTVAAASMNAGTNTSDSSTHAA